MAGTFPFELLSDWTREMTVRAVWTLIGCSLSMSFSGGVALRADTGSGTFSVEKRTQKQKGNRWSSWLWFRRDSAGFSWTLQWFLPMFYRTRLRSKLFYELHQVRPKETASQQQHHSAASGSGSDGFYQNGANRVDSRGWEEVPSRSFRH